MATKTISLDIESYERLRSARTSERESFSKVIKRAIWVAPVGTAGDLLAWRKNEGSEALDKVTLNELDASQDADSVAESKWQA
ncbi:MAG: antitoxin VapB family protein [Verrucomicrobiales bacterium]|nr:antitoxin VapB family protein [Verrucomicrobiales bacterium]